jgi:DNA-binding NtrC family response regulator
VDVRFLAATSTDLAAAAAAGTFRADLFHRIRRLEIAVPPLREREGDVALLARHFLAEHGSRLGREAPEIDGGALALLAGYSWPGNVRELETVVLRALLETAAPGPLGARDLAPLLAGRPPPALPKDLLERSLDAWRAELEREYIQRLFARSGGDPRPVMAALGVKRTKLYAWLRKLGMDVRELRGR